MLQRLEARLDRVQAAMPPRGPWFSQAEHAAMSEAIRAHCAGQEPPATALQTLGMTAGEFSDMLARVEASC